MSGGEEKEESYRAVAAKFSPGRTKYQELTLPLEFGGLAIS